MAMFNITVPNFGAVGIVTPVSYTHLDVYKRQMLERSLKRIEDSTLGQDSEDDFGGLFSDIDLASPKSVSYTHLDVYKRQVP